MNFPTLHTFPFKLEHIHGHITPRSRESCHDPFPFFISPPNPKHQRKPGSLHDISLSSPTQQTDLLSLPLELRQQIYRCLLYGSEAVDTEIDYGEFRRDLENEIDIIAGTKLEQALYSTYGTK